MQKAGLLEIKGVTGEGRVGKVLRKRAVGYEVDIRISL